MAKVYGIHLLELHPHVKAEDFERYIKEELNPIAVREYVADVVSFTDYVVVG